MWKAEVNIKHDLNNFNGTNMSEVCLAVVAKLKQSGHFSDSALSRLTDAIRYEDVDAFDQAMNVIYDIADKEMIWLG